MIILGDGLRFYKILDTSVKKWRKVCKFGRKFVYLHRQSNRFDYPGDIPARGKPLSTLPI